MAIAPNSFANRVTVHHDLVVPIPAGITTAAAATLPVAFTTAYYSLVKLAQLRPGERVLIHTATGGVGQAAIQIAQSIGAEIFATASPDKWSCLRQLGVQQMMNSRTLDFSDKIITLTEGAGVQVVLNTLPGEARAKSLEGLAKGGRFIELGKGTGITPEYIAQIRPDVAHFTVDLSALCAHQPTLIHPMLTHIAQQIAAGTWHPLPTTEFRHTDITQAFRTLQRATHIGKIIVTQETTTAQSVQPPADNAQQEIRFQPDGVYVITGGLGGLGLLVAEWMAKWGATQIVLLSRRQPTREIQAQISVLEQQNVRVDVISVDVTDAAALNQAFEEIQRRSQLAVPPQNRVRGVIHAAGVLEDGLIQHLDWAQFERVLAPKVTGAWNLHQLTLDCDLDFFVLFSSAASLLGSPGQANHAAANAFLDGLAHYRQQIGLPAFSINWGAWSAVGSAVSYQRQGSLKHVAGVEVIDPEQGIAKLEALWQAAIPQVGVVPITESQFLTQSPIGQLPFFKSLGDTQWDGKWHGKAARLQNHLPESPSVRNAASFLDRFTNTPIDQRRSLLDTHVCQQVCQILGFHPDELDPQVGFFDLGMDSLTALELKNSLQNSLGISLPTTLVFDYPTVEALLNYLADQMVSQEFLHQIHPDSRDESDKAIASLPGHPSSADPSSIAKTDVVSEQLSGDALAALIDQKLDDLETLLAKEDAS
jgi:NADPH:quinone reductase-like Zn-dependent oxidoreductase/NADP-dependent 3-hydroxy acid dehydrogenase YdfG/acyl carrier protein